MLVEVEIRDFAIVRAARLELGPGLCVLTGETGAGKSIVIDAIGALLGERAGADLIRAGAAAARLRAVFDLADAPAAAALLDELDLPVADGLCIIAREIAATGRSRCSVNGSTATVAMLRRLGDALIDIHGQHEHQSLLRVSQHGGLLDAHGGEAVQTALRSYRATFAAWRDATAELERLRTGAGESARRADLLRFQVDEISGAQLQPDELAELEGERLRLAHAERLLAAAATAATALAGGDDERGAVDRVAQAVDAVRDMAAFDPRLEPLAAELDGALATLGDAARALARYADEVEADPRRLDEVEQRLDQIDKLRRKYGDTIAAILAFGDRAAAELEQIDTADQREGALAARVEQLTAELRAAATALSAARAATAERFTTGVVEHLADLGMGAVRFAVHLGHRPPEAHPLTVAGEAVGAGPDGIDTVEFLFSANPGEAPRPLARIASGGEISRVMLALKSQLAANDAIPSLVFDEIDVGIGGVTIHNVARKMAALAAHRQVICITHHAPIAARADRHLAIEKASEADATAVAIRPLGGDQQVAELARMLGRVPPTAATLALARELLAEVAAEA